MIGILPYKKGLNSAKLMRMAGATILSMTSKPKKKRIVCSWGCSEIPPWANRVTWVNHPAAIPLVSNKLNWFRTGLGPEYTEDIEVAKAWAADKGEKTVCRTILNGHGGAGIVIARNPEQVVPAKVYTKYHKKTTEFRVMFSPATGVIYAWSKRRRPDVEFTKDQLLIRVLESGYVYQREQAVPQAVTSKLTEVGEKLQGYGLHLGAYDVGYNRETDSAVIYEINTAAGLNDDTALATLDAIKLVGNYLKE